MFFWIAVSAWLIGIIISFLNGNVKLPLVILILGSLVIIGMLFFSVGWFGLSALAVMTVVILIANKLDAAC